jgi:beta-lactam-binding protein with PASTA domain
LYFSQFTVTLNREKAANLRMDTKKTIQKNALNNQASQSATSKKEGKRSSLLLNLIAMVGVVILLFVLTLAALNLYTRHNEEIIVPNVKGMSAKAAIKKLEDLGLRTSIDDSVYVKSLPANSIYEQSIQGGDAVKENRLIHLTINSGNAPQLILPDIADNSSLREATARLTALGFKLGPVEYMKGEKDWVYEVKCRGRNIGAGSHVDADDEIVLVVGDGTYYDNDTQDEMENDTTLGETDHTNSDNE